MMYNVNNLQEFTYKLFSKTFFSFLESRIDTYNYLDLTELCEFEGKLLLNQNEC